MVSTSMLLCILCTIFVISFPRASVAAGLDYRFSIKSEATGPQIFNPNGLAMRTSGGTQEIAITEIDGHRVSVYNAATGALIRTIGAPGIANGQLNHPHAVAYANADFIVADTHNNRIQRFSSTGTYMWQSGTTGTASGAAEFMYPESLAVSVANSEIYVADTLNHRVVILNLNDGSYKSEFGGFNEDPQTFSGFNEPRGIAVDSTGKLLVADSRNNRIVIIPRNSNTYAMGDASVLDTSGWDAGWNFPVSVSVDSSDNAIVSDFRNTRVVRGSQGGTFLGFVGGAPGTDMTQIQYPKSALYDGTYYYIADAGNGCLTVLLADGTASTRNIAKKTSFPSVLGPQGVTVTPKGGIVVADTLHHRINFYMPNGTLDYEWAPIGEMGTWALYHPGQLSIVNINDPTAQDGIGVADTKNHRIVSVWKASGQWDRFGDFGSYGRDINSKQFNSPKAVASCFDQVWVADTMNHRVVQFNNILGDVMFNTYPAQPGTVPSVYVPSSANGEFNMPSALVCTSQYLYVADSGNNRVQIFSWSTGNNNVQYVDSVAVNYPVGLGMAKGDLLYVTSLFDATVTAFQIQGNGLLVASAADDFGGLGSTDGLFKTPNGLSATQNAYMFATDTLNNKVQGFCEVLTYTANDAKLQTTSYDKQELVTFAGPGPFTFNIVSGTVIPGTTFSTTDTALVISGTPADAAAGNTYPFTISVTDAFGCSTGDFAISLEVFERITLSGYTVSDNDTRGGGLLEITGTRFTAIADPIIYIGDGVLVPKRLCSQNDGVISDTTLRCVVPEGVGKLNKVIVEVAGTVYMFANLFAYGAPIIDSITTNVPTLHQSDPVFFITINGKNFGNEPYAGGYIQHFSVAGLGCYGGNPAFVDTQSIVIRCEAPESVGTANPLRLSIGNYPGDAQEVRSTVSYVPATVTDCDDVSTHNIVAHPGQTVVTICGADFGNPTYDPQWTGHRAIRVGRQPCDSVEWTWDKAICVVPSNQMGANNKVTLDVNGVLVKANMTVSFLPPHVTSLAPLSIQTAGNVLTINGGNFGADASRVNVKIGVNGYCSGIVLLSQSKLYCKAYGSGANQAVVVTVEGQVSDGWVVVDFTKPTDGLSCHSPLGAQDQFADDRCNCYSGYAPSNERGIDCNVKATCAPRDVSSTVVVMEYVKHIQFKDDKVLVKIDAPILHNARDFHISFTSAQGSTCNYPGPIWEKTVDALDCRDVYTAAMPWSANGLCGFNLTGSSIHSNKRVVTPTQYNYHTAPVTLTMRLIQGSIQRKVSSSFLLSVKFATQLQVSTVAITTLEPYLEAQLVTFNIINGYSTLDLDNPQYIIEFETSVINKFELSTLTGSVNNISTSVVVVPNAAGPGEALCSRGDCVQQWVATVNIPSPCDGATVILIPQLICRDPEDICDVVNIYAGNATLLIAANKDANCGVEKNADATDGLSVSILTYENYNNQDLSNTMLVNDLVSGPEQNTFVGRNSKIMVLVKVVEPQTSIDMITLNSLTIQGDFPDQILYQVTTPGVRNTPLIPEAKLNFTELRRSGHDAVALSPNQEGYLALAFTLYDLPVSPDAPVSVEISIAIDLFYHGNDGDRKKRSFISDLPVDPTNTIEKSKIIFVEYENNNEYDEEAQNAETLLDDGFGWSFSSASRVAKIELLVASLLVAVIALVL